MKQKLTMTLAASAASFLLVGVGAVASTRVQPLQMSPSESQPVVVVNQANQADSVTSPVSFAPQVSAPAALADSLAIPAPDSSHDEQAHELLLVALESNHNKPVAKKSAKAAALSLGKASAKTMKALLQAQVTSATTAKAKMNMACAPTPVASNVQGSTQGGGQ